MVCAGRIHIGHTVTMDDTLPSVWVKLPRHICMEADCAKFRKLLKKLTVLTEVICRLTFSLSALYCSKAVATTKIKLK